MLEFRDIFSTELSLEPADLPPLDVHIDTANKWHQPKNQGRPRNHSIEGQQEIKRHLEKLLECRAISPVLYAVGSCAGGAASHCLYLSLYGIGFLWDYS